MSVQQRRKYDPEIKRDAVQLTEAAGRTVAGVAENLGISKDLLYRWRRAQRVSKDLAFPGNRKFGRLRKGSRMSKWHLNSLKKTARHFR